MQLHPTDEKKTLFPSYFRETKGKDSHVWTYDLLDFSRCLYDRKVHIYYLVFLMLMLLLFSPSPSSPPRLPPSLP